MPDGRMGVARHKSRCSREGSCRKNRGRSWRSDPHRALYKALTVVMAAAVRAASWSWTRQVDLLLPAARAGAWLAFAPYSCSASFLDFDG
jgi:hypothetical protein|eukprot:7381669-Prymnesium_polylepis.1